MTSKMISTEQAATEAFIEGRIEAHDVNVLLDYATFVEQELDSEPIRNLLLGIMRTPSRQWDFAVAEVATHDRKLGDALRQLGIIVEQQRAAFMEFRAIAMLKEAAGEQA